MDWHSLFTRLTHSDNGRLIIGYDEIQQWPDGILENLIKLKLLRKIHDAKTVICEECEEQCCEMVRTFPGQNLSFIHCTRRDDTNHVLIPIERLQQWQISLSDIHASISCETGLSLPVVADLPLVWRKAFVLTGDSLVIDSHYVLAQATMFRRNGESPSTNRIEMYASHWVVTFQQQIRTVKLLKGLRYILYLIRHQGREIHVSELARAVDSVDVSLINQSLSEQSAAQLAEAGLSLDFNSRFEVIDQQTIIACKVRCQELHDLIEDAKDLGDVGEQERLEVEKEKIEQYLAANLRKGGQSRLSTSPTETERKRIEKNIRRAVTELKTNFPVLAEHFRHIQTGEYCCYSPNPDIEWKIIEI